jgi:hypothetical protein
VAAAFRRRPDGPLRDVRTAVVHPSPARLKRLGGHASVSPSDDTVWIAGDNGMKRWVGLGVIADNLLNIGRAIGQAPEVRAACIEVHGRIPGCAGGGG